MDRVNIAVVAPTARRARGSSGTLSPWRRRRELRAARREADAELLGSEFASPRTAWRAAELTESKNRLALARSIRRLIRSADARYLPGPTPLNRIGVRLEIDALEALAERLATLERPVTPRGVLLLDRLLTDGFGPLYVSYRAVELRSALDRAAKAFEVKR
jgi:hypothetical protein